MDSGDASALRAAGHELDRVEQPRSGKKGQAPDDDLRLGNVRGQQIALEESREERASEQPGTGQSCITPTRSLATRSMSVSMTS